MKTLEELLQELGCEGSAFDSTGEFTKAGEKAYERLEHLLYDIESLTGKLSAACGRFQISFSYSLGPPSSYHR